MSEPRKKELHSHRIGEFFVRTDRLAPDAERWEHLRIAQQGCTVLHCEHQDYRDGFKVIAVHPSFDPVAPGSRPPQYTAEFTKWTGGEITCRFVRVPTPIPGARQR